MSSGQWEVVGKKPKSSTKDGDKNKTETKKATVEMPLPSKEEAFKNLQKFKLSSKNSQKKGNDVSQKKGQPAPPSKNQKSSNKKPSTGRCKTLKEAITKLNLSELQNLSKTLRKQYNFAPLVWLKDLASFLNIKLNPSTPVDSAYRQESVANAPLGYLSMPVREFLVAVIQNCDIEVLSQFHKHCSISMLQESTRGLPVHGYALFIQVIGNVCREASALHYEDYIGYRSLFDGHPRSGLTYVWVLSHAIVTAAEGKFYAPAVKMWMEGLIPLLGSKHYSGLIANCGKQMISKIDLSFLSTKPKKTKGSEEKRPGGVIVSAEYIINLVDVISSSDTQIPRAILKQLSDILDKLRIVCTLTSIPGTDVESVSLVQTLLPRFSCLSDTEEDLLVPIFASCLECSESKCLKEWSSMLEDNLVQTGNVIKLLSQHDEYCRVLSTPSFNKTLRSFKSRAVTDTESIQAEECSKVITQVLTDFPVGSGSRKKSSDVAGQGSSSWFRVSLRVLFWVFIFSSFIRYYSTYLDNNKHEFDQSPIGKVANLLGMKKETQNAAHTIAVFSNRTALRSFELMKHTLEVVKPYTDVLQVKAASASQWAAAELPGVMDKGSEILSSIREIMTRFGGQISQVVTDALKKFK